MKTLINIVLCALFLSSNFIAYSANISLNEEDTTSTKVVNSQTKIFKPKGASLEMIQAAITVENKTTVKQTSHNLQVANADGIYALDFYSITGKRVYSYVLNGQEQHNFSTSSFVKGAYILYVIDVNENIDVIKIAL